MLSSHSFDNLPKHRLSGPKSPPQLRYLPMPIPTTNQPTTNHPPHPQRESRFISLGEPKQAVGGDGLPRRGTPPDPSGETLQRVPLVRFSLPVRKETARNCLLVKPRCAPSGNLPKHRLSWPESAPQLRCLPIPIPVLYTSECDTSAANLRRIAAICIAIHLSALTFDAKQCYNIRQTIEKGKFDVTGNGTTNSQGNAQSTL